MASSLTPTLAVTGENRQVPVSGANPDVARVVSDPGLRLPQLIEGVLSGYGDRPALVGGDGHVVTYAELLRRVRALMTAWRPDLEPGGFVAVLGFTSVDFATIDLTTAVAGAVSVPLQTSASAARLRAILDEATPTVLAVSAQHLGDAVAVAPGLGSLRRLVVFDDDGVDLASARAAVGPGVVVTTLADDVAAGSAGPQAPFHQPADGDDPLVTLIYTSGSTGTPKGAMYTERLVTRSWRRGHARFEGAVPSLLHFMPMSHMYGRNWVLAGLASGGVGYFASAPDMSTLFDDLSRARPTAISLVPRVCELVHQRYLAMVDRAGDSEQASGATGDRDQASGATGETALPRAEAARRHLRDDVFGGRVAKSVCGSAPLSSELKAFMEWVLGVPVEIGFGSTETGVMLRDGVVMRPPVREYRLVDVPELGYRTTDRPYPRGELMVTSDDLIPGYYHRPDINAEVFDADGFYRTGDIMAELGPDRLEYVDRRSNVIKLSQGEFVAVALLEARYEADPDLRQVYVFGSSEQSYLLAVVVPSDIGPETDVAARARVSAAFARVAAAAELNAYEVPRDFVLERRPFTQENGLLSGIGKLLRPALAREYGPRLEQMYADAAARSRDELATLSADGDVATTVLRAAALTLGVEVAQVGPDAGFGDLGGDSLSALTLSTTLEAVFGVAVPVQLIVGPTATLARVAGHIEAARSGALQRPTVASVHGVDATVARAADLALERFVAPDLIAAAPGLPVATGEPETVLLTGATGYLGRFLCLQWLERVAPRGGTVVALARGADADAARERIVRAIGDDDPALAARFAELADHHLEVHVGDIAEPDLGLSPAEWADLAGRVDHVVHCGALVNHVLPYSQLFGPNVVGTGEIIRCALTSRRKPVTYVSTVAVAARGDGGLIGEDDDVRTASAQRPIEGGYANGYAVSKWAGEVLLREAADRCDLPVAVFRSDMILAHSRYLGQFNDTDMFTRLLFSLARTQLAPATFYGAGTGAARPHYDGLPVDFTAEAITTLGAAVREGFRTYNVLNSNDDGISLDTFAGWLEEDGVPLTRVADYDEWFQRFEQSLRALPEVDRQRSMIPLLDSVRRPARGGAGGEAPTEQFRAAVRAAGVGSGDIPSIDHALISTYLEDLRVAGWL